MVEKTLKIDRKSPVPLHLQIKNQIQEKIYGGAFRDGKKLPPSRKLAQHLGVNRTTVVSAYNELLAAGLVETRVGMGTVVKQRDINGRAYRRVHPLNWSEYYGIYPGTIQDSLIRDLLEQSAKEDIIPLATGMPDPETFPAAELEEIFRRLFVRKGREILKSLPTEGYYPLRRSLADWMIEEGNASSPDEVLIVSGAIQGLYLLARTFISPGDLVVVESPAFMGALRLFQASGARIIEIPVDEDGIRIDMLENLLSRQNPKFIYTNPTFQNPRGFVLSIERRQKLLDLAYRFHVPIIEEDPYSKMYYDEPPPPSLKSLDTHNYVIYLGTFSKILFPGLRIGWVNADKSVLDHLSREKQLMDLHSNTISQYALHEFLQSGRLAPHLEKIRRTYANKRDLMTACLIKHCSSLITWNEPQGGYYLWCALQEGFNTRDVIRELYEEDVAVLAGEVFFLEGKGQKFFRLNFTLPREQQIEEGIRRLRKAILRLKRKARSRGDPGKLPANPIV